MFMLRRDVACHADLDDDDEVVVEDEELKHLVPVWIQLDFESQVPHALLVSLNQIPAVGLAVFRDAGIQSRLALWAGGALFCFFDLDFSHWFRHVEERGIPTQLNLPDRREAYLICGRPSFVPCDLFGDSEVYHRGRQMLVLDDI